MALDYTKARKHFTINKSSGRFGVSEIKEVTDVSVCSKFARYCFASQL